MRYANKEKGATCQVACSQCARPTMHTILESVETVVGEEVVGGQIYGFCEYLNYQVIQCRGCEQISFRRVMFDDGCAFQLPDGSTDYRITQALFPARLAGRKQIEGKQHLPDKLRRIYEEVHAAASNQLDIIAGIGARAIVEAVCKEKQARGNNLKDQIDDLVTRQVLTDDGAKILHRMRFLGNKAAHEVEPPTDAELSAALTVAEHLLQTVYILSKIAEALPKEAS